MNDITALMATMKAAAEKATPGEWSVQFGDEVYATDGVENEQVAIATNDARDADFIALANPANVLALVEALEKAQQDSDGVAGMAEHYETTISMLRGRITELEESHAQVIQSRDHYKRMSEEGLKQLVESRIVTVKLPAACADDEYFNDGVFQPMRYERDVERALRAAGIQVIEGEGQ